MQGARRTRRAVALLAVVALAAACAPPFAPDPLVVAGVARPHSGRPARVLLLGDSIMNQMGEHAAVALRAAGVEVRVEGWWGSGLLTRGQYDLGATRPDPEPGSWLARAPQIVAELDPDLVVVYLNHNYWPPYPRDAWGREIVPGTPAFTGMVHAQAAALVQRLRARGAGVVFASPVPSSPNAIWDAYASVVGPLGVGVVRAGDALGPEGRRFEILGDCGRLPDRVRPPDDVHLTRFGAGAAGTALARAVARLVGADLQGTSAPGERAVALVPTAAGYLLAACDGGVAPFGDAAFRGGAVDTRTPGVPVVGAAATPSHGGYWLADAQGSVSAHGDAAAAGDLRALDLQQPVVGMAATPTGGGYWLVAADGGVFAFGDAPYLGSLGGVRLRSPVVGMAPTPTGGGYWLVAADGGVFAFGDAPYLGSLGGVRLRSPVVGMAATPPGAGYWLVAADGGVFTFGDAPFGGSAADAGVTAVAIAAAPRGGYWVLDRNGGVHAFAGAPFAGDTAGLALRTD